MAVGDDEAVWLSDLRNGCGLERHETYVRDEAHEVEILSLEKRIDVNRQAPRSVRSCQDRGRGVETLQLLLRDAYPPVERERAGCEERDDENSRYELWKGHNYEYSLDVMRGKYINYF